MIYIRAWMSVPIILLCFGEVGCKTPSNQRAESQNSELEFDYLKNTSKPPQANASASTGRPASHEYIAEAAFAEDGDQLSEVVVIPVEEVVGDADIGAQNRTLQLGDLIESVRVHYPAIVSARLNREVADGKQLAAWGEFDTNVKAFNDNGPLGFYQTYRNGVSIEKPLYRGGYVYSGYKIGDGNFQPWYKERETNEGGEFSVGFGLPLLKGNAIDKRRAELAKAGAARQAVEPAIQAQVIGYVRNASQVYWSWVAAGKILAANRSLLENAKERVSQIEARIKAEDLAAIARINNNQLIAARQTKVIESERKLQASAIKLSLYLRDIQGNPVIPDESMLPIEFPGIPAFSPDQLQSDIDVAVAARPEIAELDFLTQQVQIELAQGQNSLLPKLDIQLRASQDVGAEASSKGDKTPFEMEVGFVGQVPLQRREGWGKIKAANGKLSQLAVKRRFVVEKTVATVQDAFSAIDAATRRIEQAETNERLAKETLELGQAQFAAGDIGILILNLYEKSATDAEILAITAKSEFFSALADYRAALSIDPY